MGWQKVGHNWAANTFAFAINRPSRSDESRPSNYMSDNLFCLKKKEDWKPLQQHQKLSLGTSDVVR